MYRYLFIIFFTFIVFPTVVFGSRDRGTFDPEDLGYNRAYLVNNSDLNNISKEIVVGKFTTQTAQNGIISDYELTGWMWGSATGWISLNCSNVSGSCATSDYKVTVDRSGYLSGYAWGPQSGWVNFAPVGAGVNTVRINENGVFSGYAWVQSFGYLSFNCSNDSSCGTVDFKTATDYVPSNYRPKTYGSIPISVVVPKLEVLDKTKIIDSNKKNKKEEKKVDLSREPFTEPSTKYFTPNTKMPEIVKPIASNDSIDNRNTSKLSWIKRLINKVVFVNNKISNSFSLEFEKILKKIQWGFVSIFNNLFKK